MNDLSDLARVVLLAFADLGVYLPNSRERIIRKIRGLDPLDPADLEQFLDLCIEADLITPEDRGRLRLSPMEAKEFGLIDEVVEARPNREEERGFRA